MSSLQEKYMLLFRQLNSGGGSEPAPVASFTWINDYPTSALTVDFTDTSTNTPTSWLWDFGDGVGTSTAQNPTYTYATAGHYDVTLTATNAAGADGDTQTVPVNAFHAAVLAAGFDRLYDLRETSGTEIANSGADGVAVGYIAGAPVKGVADATGNPDAFTFNDSAQGFNLFPKTFTDITVAFLIKMTGAGATCSLTLEDTATINSVILTVSKSGALGSFGAIVTSGGTFETAQVFSDDFINATDTYVLFARYNNTTRAVEIRYSDDGTIKTPSYALNESPIPTALGATDADNSVLTSGISGGASYTLGAPFYTAAFLNDAALLPIAQAVFNP